MSVKMARWYGYVLMAIAVIIGYIPREWMERPPALTDVLIMFVGGTICLAMYHCFTPEEKQ